MKIKESSIIEKNNKLVFENFSNIENFKNLMPEKTKFNHNENGFDFTIEGMPSIEVAILEKIENEKISFISTSKSSVKFQIDFLFNYISENKTNCDIILTANTNPFLKIMIEKPLSNLIKLFSERVKNI